MSAEQGQYSRREFLKMVGLIAGGAALTTTGIKVSDNQKEPASLVGKTSLPDIAPKPLAFNSDIIQPRHNSLESYAATGLEQLGFMTIEIPLGKIVKKTGTSNPDPEYLPTIVKQFLENPVSASIQTCLIGPFNEEFLFRLFPSALVQKGSMQWTTGIAQALIFGQMHSGKYFFSKEHIQYRRIASGLFHWYLMREKGFLHTLFAHVINNSIASSLLLKTINDHKEEIKEQFLNSKEDQSSSAYLGGMEG